MCTMAEIRINRLITLGNQLDFQLHSDESIATFHTGGFEDLNRTVFDEIALSNPYNYHVYEAEKIITFGPMEFPWTIDFTCQ